MEVIMIIITPELLRIFVLILINKKKTRNCRKKLETWFISHFGNKYDTGLIFVFNFLMIHIPGTLDAFSRYE